MDKYHKIQTMWLRNPDTKFRTLLEGQWALPEFGYLSDLDWVFTEKVDGTNIRVHWARETNAIRLGGRTDNAQIPAFLVERIYELLPPDKFKAAFPDCSEVTLYGEGFGARIQKGGGNYIPNGVSFALFDVNIGGNWLERENVEDISDKLELQCVPVIGVGPLGVAVDVARDGFKSAWGEFPAEGIVCRPKVELQTRRGHRVITKIKAKDFANFR